MQKQNDGKAKEAISKTKIVVFVLFVLTATWFIFFLLSVPSIAEYCEDRKLAWFDIDIWKNENCTQYWEIKNAKYETKTLKHQYNISITFKDLY